jgi:hypothetical protein
LLRAVKFVTTDFLRVSVNRFGARTFASFFHIKWSTDAHQTGDASSAGTLEVQQLILVTQGQGTVLRKVQLDASFARRLFDRFKTLGRVFVANVFAETRKVFLWMQEIMSLNPEKIFFSNSPCTPRSSQRPLPRT